MNKKKLVNVTKIEKNDSNLFNNKINKLNGVVLFHHPGCIHCIMLKPKWEMMKKQLHSAGEIMEVNAMALEKSDSPIKDKIEGFPMIVRITNGEITDKFSEERNVENMLKFVTKHLNETNNKLDYNYKFKNSKKKNIVKIKKTNKRKTNKHKTQKGKK